MRRNVIHFVAVCVVVSGLASLAMAADPWVGKWELNLEKSEAAATAMNVRSLTVRIEEQANGIRQLNDYVYSDGKTTHREFTAKFDGKEYPLQGNPLVDTIVLTKVDAYTYDTLSKKDGKEIGISRTVVSQDGKTMTSTLKVSNAQGQQGILTMVYDKQ